MISVTAGEQVLIPAHKPGWLPVMTLADMQDLAYRLPLVTMQTIGLLLTGGEDGIIAGGTIGTPEAGSIPVQHLVGVQSGRPVVYADPDGRLRAEPIPVNESGADQYVTIYVRRTDIETVEKRIFRNDSKALSDNTVADSGDPVVVRLSAGVEIAFDIEDHPTGGKADFLRLGYATLPPGSNVAVDPVSVQWTPMTAAAHRGQSGADGLPVFDHPDASVTREKLAPEFAGGWSEDEDASIGELSEEIAAAQTTAERFSEGDYIPEGATQGGIIPAAWLLSQRLDRLLRRAPPSGIVEQQVDLKKQVSNIADEMFASTTPDFPSAFKRGADGRYEMTQAAAADAAGALVRVTETHTPHDPQSAARWGDWGINDPSWPQEAAKPADDPRQGEPEGMDIPEGGYSTAHDWLKTLFAFPSLSHVVTGATGGHTWLHNIGHIVCTANTPEQVLCFVQTERTQDASGPLEEPWIQRHQGQYSYLALGTSETPDPEER